MWPTGAAHPSRYGALPHHEMGMFVVAPATSFHHDPSLISADVGAIQFWQTQQAAGYLNKSGSISFDHNAAGAANAPSSGGDGGVGSTTCQDCGNQAKKDCGHRRCRTCCRSRGFDCSTHLKSTWVPAARRRERQMVPGNSSGGGCGGGASSGSTSGAKKPRLIASQNTTTTTNSQTSNSNTPPRSFDTTSSHQEAVLKDSLPRQVRAPAVFKCVRVTAMDEGDDEYAYQAMVRIGGRIFKGFLYDQGTHEFGDGFPNLSELHLGGSGGGGGGGGRNGMASSSSPLLDPSEVYGASGGGIPGGSGYGNTIN